MGWETVGVILTRSRGDTEEDAERQKETENLARRQRRFRCPAARRARESKTGENTMTENHRVRKGFRREHRGKRRVLCHGVARGGRGWETRECDFDAEARRRGDQRREAAQSKRGRARRQRRMVAFGAERTGFRREHRGKRRENLGGLGRERVRALLGLAGLSLPHQSMPPGMGAWQPGRLRYASYSMARSAMVRAMMDLAVCRRFSAS